MSLMDLKVLREIKSNKFRSILIIITVALTIALVVGMRGGYPMLMASYEENLLKQNVADGRFTFSSSIQQANVSIIEQDKDFLKEQHLDEIEGRILIKTELTYNNEKFQAIVIGIDYPNRINQLVIEKQEKNINPDNDFLKDSQNCILESKFAGDFLGQNVQLDEKLKITLGETTKTFRVKAIGQDTDFLYVVDPVSGMTLMGQMAVVWVDLKVLQDALFAGAPMINQILFTLDDRLDKKQVNKAADGLTEYLAKNGVAVNTMDFEIYDDTLDRQFFDADAGSIDEMGTIFGIIGLIMCSVVIYGMLSRLVQSQRRNIGLFMSLGAKKRTILFHYVKITVLLSVIGVLIGLPLAYGFSIGMMRMAGRLYALKYYVYPIAIEEYLLGSFLTLGVCALFSALSTISILKITPRAAMAAFFNRIKVTKETLSEKIFGWIPGFRSLHMRVALREVFLRKKKSLITILAISVSMMILINSLAMVANMNSSFKDYYEKYNKADIEIKLEQPVPISIIENYMANQSDKQITHYESYVSVYTKLTFENDFKSWMELKCYQKNSTIRNLNIISGDINSKNELDSSEILLGQSIAGKYDIPIEHEIKLGTSDHYSVKVVGLVGELIDFGAFWILEAFYKDNISLDYFGVPNGYVNGILLNLGDNVDKNDLQKDFEDYFDISQWIDAEQSKESIMNLMESMMGMLWLYLLLGVLIGIIFSFNTMYMSLLSRMNDYIAFKAMGTKTKYIRNMIFWENAILSVFSLFITIPLGYIFYWWSMDYMMGDRFYIPISIPLYTWPLVFALGLCSIWLATRRIMKKIKNLVLADELRQRIIS